MSVLHLSYVPPTPVLQLSYILYTQFITTVMNCVCGENQETRGYKKVRGRKGTRAYGCGLFQIKFLFEPFVIFDFSRHHI